MRLAVFLGLLGVVSGLWAPIALAADAPPLEPRDQAIRDRYQQMLQKDPLQERAFTAVYESFLEYDGVAEWVKSIEEALGEDSSVRHVLLGRIAVRQFETSEAITHLKKAQELGEKRPALNALLGTLCYETGRDDEAITFLNGFLEAESDPEKRTGVVRILGALYQRQGKREEALAAWKRLTEHDPDDVFTQLELAELYEDHRMWKEAIAVHERLIELSADTPYRQCRAWRSIGSLYLRMEDYAQAIASYEKALALVAPGNWLFEDLKTRLVSVYQDMGDLSGLAEYLLAKIAETPGDIEFRDLLAETYARMGKFEEAEKAHRAVLERAPKRAQTYEALIRLYEKQDLKDKITEACTKLAELFPEDIDYVRRLGEAQWRAGATEDAKQTWRKVLSEEPAAWEYAQLAAWYEQYEFPEEAMAAYAKAIAKEASKEWTFRLAALKYEAGGEEEALALWQSVLEEGKSGAEDYGEVAGILQSFEFYAESAALLAKAIDLDPEALEHRAALADLLSRQEEYEKSIAHYTVLADQRENEFFQERGERGLLNAYAALGMLEEKHKEWAAAVEAAPEAVEPKLRLARLYERSGNRLAAIELYKKAVELQPEDTDLLRTLAEAYRGNRQDKEAIEAYTRLIELDRNRAGGYYSELLRIHVRSGNKDDALAAGEKIVELRPADPEARLDLAQTYWQFGKQDEALEQYRYALRLEPNEPQYYAQYGQFLSAKQRWAEAEHAYRKMLETARNDDTRVSAIGQLGRVYLQLGRFDELAREFQDRVRNAPTKLAAYEELAAVHKAAGDMQRALEVLESGLDAVEEKEPALRKLLSEAYAVNDYEKVVACYEQLIGQAGKATPYELDRLGKAYARLGHGKEARAAWNRIIEENPEDAQSHEMVARNLLDHGFLEEGMGLMRSTLDLDPYDYALRFELAQTLAASEQYDEALKQLQTILELGGRPPDPGDAKKDAEKKVRPLHQAYGHSRHMLYYSHPGMQRGYGSYRGQRWQGSFDQFRPQVVATMVSMGQVIGAVDDVLAPFEKQYEEMPQSIDAGEDLLAAYQAANKRTEALALREALIDLQPDNTQLVQGVVSQYQQDQEFDKALALCKKYLERNPGHRTRFVHLMASLYTKLEQKDKAKAEILAFRESDPDNPQVMVQTANFLMQILDETDEAQALIERAKELDPQNAWNYERQLVGLYQQRGEMEKVRAYYESVLFDSVPSGQRRTAQRGKPRLYVAFAQQGRSNLLANPHSLHQTVFPSLDHQKTQAMTQVIRALTDDAERAEFLARMEQEMRASLENEDPAVRKKGTELGKLLFAYDCTQAEFEKARSLLGLMIEGVPGDVELIGCRLLLLEHDTDLEGLMAAYEELEPLFPNEARQIALARVNIAMAERKYDEAAEQIRHLIRGGMQASQLRSQIAGLQNGGAVELAQGLLEEMVSGLNRDPEILNLLASVYSRQEKHEKAIALARESWEGQVQTGSYRPYWGTHYYHSSMGRDQGLQQLHRYYKQAGREGELIQEFEERLKKQPGSQQFYRNLITLYQASNRPQRALELYEELMKRQPNNTQVRLQYAEALRKGKRNDEALALYQELLKQRPSMYRSINWQMKELFREMGRTNELGELEDEMAKRTNNPDDLENLVRAAQERKDYDRAIALYKRIIALRPGMPEYLKRIAAAYDQAGKAEEALAHYEEYLKATENTGFVFHDLGMLRKVASIHDKRGSLDEFKKRVAERLAKDAKDVRALMLEGQIAVHEKRYDDALASLEKVREQGGSGQHYAVTEMARIAEVKGDYARAIELLESLMRTNQHQDWDRLAKLCVKGGDKAKAFEYWKRQAGQYGGAHGYVQILRRLIEHRMWEEAEAYIAEEGKRVALDPNASRQWKDRIVRAYFEEGGRFKETIESGLLSEPTKENAELIRQYSHRDTGTRDRAAELLKAMLEKEPENREILMAYAEVLRRQEKREETAAIYAKLVEQDKTDVNVLRQYMDMMYRLDRKDEMVAVCEAAFEEMPSLATVRILYDAYSRTNSKHKLIELRGKALERVPESERDEVKVLFASVAAEAGDIEGAKEVLRKDFEEKKNAQAFSKYVSFLTRHGMKEEAYKVAKESLDPKAGMSIDLMRSHDVLRLFVEFKDHDLVDELVLKCGEQGEEWRVQQAFRYCYDAYRQHGKGKAFLERIEAKVLKLQNPPPIMLLGLAQAFQQAEDFEGALKLCGLFLTKNPAHPEACRLKAGILIKEKRFDEAAAFLDELRKGLSPQDMMNYGQEIVRAYKDAGKVEEAEAVIDGISVSDDRPHDYYRRGSMYYATGFYEKALADYDAYRKAPGVRESDAWRIEGNIATCYAELGRIDEGMKLWKKREGSQGFDGFARALEKKERFAEAAEVYGSVLERDQERSDYVVRIAECRHQAGDTNAYRKIFADAYPKIPKSRRNNMRYQYADFLRKHKLIESLFDMQDLATDPALQEALAVCVGFMRGDDSAGKRAKLARMVLKSGLDDPQILLELAEGLRGTEVKEERIALLVRVGNHPKARSREIERVARSLAGLGAETDEAFALYEKLIAADPGILVRDSSVVRMLAEAENREKAAALLAYLDKAEISPWLKAFLRTEFDYYAGNKEQAVKKLEELAKAPDAEGSRLGSVSNLLAEEKRYDAALEASLRALDSPDTADQRGWHLLQTLRLSLKAGKRAKAWECFAVFFPEHLGRAADALPALVEDANAENMDEILGIVQRLIREKPDHDRVSYLLGLADQLTEKFGREETAESLADACGVTGEEKAQALVWQNMIETWKVAGPYDLQRGSDGGEAQGPSGAQPGSEEKEQGMKDDLSPELLALAKGEAALADTKMTWLATDPKATIGFVVLTDVFGMDKGDARKKGTYAVTELVSPDDRTIEFAHGSDDWVRIWVNGQEVHSNLTGREAHPEQDRFKATLKKGRNRVLMRTGNSYDDWMFSLSPATNFEGLEIAAP